ncbi:MAG: beta-lactamase family protein [Thermomicrobiaceae bacterium]|nr:beta-lactamase family protein [Thermomicrobiaceae bacterium]
MADARFEDLVEHARAEMARWRVPGLTLGVLDADGAVEVAGLGATSLETGWPVSPDTLFQIGSISKVFCTTLVMTLVDEGRVDLDAPIRAYLPDLALADPAAPGAITVRHLLTHQSGIWGDFFDDFGWGDDALARALAHMRALEQLYPPGELWSYCNAGFQLAGAIVERVLGQPFEAAMRERVLAPLGLERTVYFPHEAFAYPHAVGHTERTPGALDFQVARDYWLHRAINPAGGLLSTARDLLRFAAFHLGDGTSNGARVLSEAALRAMREPQTPAANWADAWGLGWDLRTIGGLQVIGHGGGTNGFITRLTVVPERRVALAVLTNASSGGAVNRAVERAALERYCGIRAPEPEVVSL